MGFAKLFDFPSFCARIPSLEGGNFISSCEKSSMLGEIACLLPKFESPQERPVQTSSIATLNRWQRQVGCANFAVLLRQCASTNGLLDGKLVHDRITRIGLERDVFLGSLLVQMYGNCGALDDARVSFRKLHHQDQFSWNFLIAAHARHGHGKEALLLFNQMQQEGMVPNQFVIPSILSACADQAALIVGKRMHARITGGAFVSDVVVGNAIVNMYGKCNILDDARRMFDTMVERNTFSWTAMIAVYAQHGLEKEALQLFDQMQREGILPNNVTFASILGACASQAVLGAGKFMHSRVATSAFLSDVTVGNALVNMYGKCGNLDSARKMFDAMPERSTLSWNAVITAYVQHEENVGALQLYDQMRQEGILPDRVTLISILSACAALAAFVEGKRVHACVEYIVYQLDIIVSNALLNMYAKCGTMEETWRVFDDLPQPDTVAWTSIIAAYAQHGQGKFALELFKTMQSQGVMPNEVTFLSVLSACSHTGLMDEGHHWFACMKNCHIMTPLVGHCNCMVDLLGRAGLLSEAEEMISSMPYQPTLVSWMVLLGACRKEADVDRAECAANHIFELDPQNATPYIMLSNIYATSGREADALKMMDTLRERGLCDTHHLE